MKRVLGVALLSVCVALAPVASAGGYPSKPIKFITSAAPGGQVDIRARMYAQRLGESLGHTIVVENRSGASGMIAVDAVMKSAPDGYTILFGSTQELLFPVALGAASYDPLRDLIPVVLTTTGYPLLLVSPSLGVKSLAELVAMAKAKQGQITCGTAGHASANHMACSYLTKVVGINVLPVPYKGSAPALLATSAGEVQFVIGFVAESQGYIAGGRLVPLAALAPTRLAQFPTVPTMTELGYEGLVLQGWTCLMAPAGTPREVVRRLNSEVVKVATRPDMTELLNKTGAVFAEYTPEEFATFLVGQIAKWRKISAETGIKGE